MHRHPSWQQSSGFAEKNEKIRVDTKKSNLEPDTRGSKAYVATLQFLFLDYLVYLSLGLIQNLDNGREMEEMLAW